MNYNKARQILLIFLLGCFYVQIANSQQFDDNILPYYDDYYDYDGSINERIDSIRSDFFKEFPTEESKRDFKDLRAYLSEKQSLSKSYTSKLNSYLGKLSTAYSTKQRNEILKRKQENKLLSLERKKLSSFSETDPYLSDNFQDTASIRAEIRRLANEIIENDKRIDKLEKNQRLIKSSLEAIKQDIESANRTVDLALAPELKGQDFKEKISLYFSFLIAILLVSFFLTVYLKSPDNITALLLNDNGLQFVTIFVLIIAVILFGILGILHGSELAAILSGISGYILGKTAKTT